MESQRELSRPRSVFAVTSVVCAGLMYVLPVLVVWLLAESRKDDHGHQGWGACVEVLLALAVGVIATVIPAIIGVITGIVSLTRREKRRWLAGIGLVLCGGLLLLFAVAAVSSQAG